MSGLSGTGIALRLLLRRDRVALPVWIVVLTGFLAGTASTFASSYPTAAARATFAASIRGNPAITAIYGPLLDDSVGGLTAWRVGVSGALFFSVFSIVTVIRHTRGEEAAGRMELLRSGILGRHAQTAAAVLVTVAAHLLVGIVAAAALIGRGLPAAGSVALVAGLAGTGVLLAAAAALIAQLTARVRVAAGLSVLLLGVLLMLRIAGDTGASWLLWLTPIGWAQLLRPFAGENPAVLVLPVVVTAAVLGATGYLAGRRDLGTGLVAVRPGPRVAGPGLDGPLALAWRTHRGTLAAVTVGALVLGLLMGSVATGVGEAVGAGSGFAAMLTRLHAPNAGVAMLQLLVYALAEIVAIYAISIALRPRTEETDGTAAYLMVAGVARTRWLGSHLVFAALCPLVCLLALGVGTGLGYGVAIGDAGVVLTMVGAALAKLPAIWVLAAVATALFGLLPRYAGAISWVLVGLMYALELGWELGAIGPGTFAVSPFAHVYPGSALTAGGVGALVAVAAVLVAAGVIGTRRRDFA